MVVEEQVEWKSGFTWRALLALLYSLFVFSPVVIWLQLVTFGVDLGSTVEYCTLLIFAEIAALYGSRITPQEAAIIFGPATVAGSAGFLGLIYQAYFTKSPLLNTFGINPMEIPKWWAPPPTSNVMDLRTFIHPDWLLPITVIVVNHFISYAGTLFFGFLGREIFIENEKLDFPIQKVTADAILTLTERPEDKMYVISWSAFIAFIYGLILYTIPAITRAIGAPVETIKIPWYDFTNIIEIVMPGAAIGIATDAIILASAFMIPVPVLIGMFIGSFIRFIIVNWLLVKFQLSAWATRWTPGMSLVRIYQDSTLYFWLNPLIGIGFAVGIVPLILRYRGFVDSIKVAFGWRRVAISKQRISGPPLSARWMILLFAVGCIGPIIFDLILVPGFPVWILIFFEILLPLIMHLMSGRMIGVTGSDIRIPYIKQMCIIASGYPKIDAWFLPLTLNPGTGWLKSLKICQLTGTDWKSWIKASLISWPLSLLVGFIYTSILWQIAPIPSEMYPAPGITWPINIMNKCVWITRPTAFFSPDVIAYWSIAFGILIFIFNRFLHMPAVMIGVATGMHTPIPMCMTMLLGLIIRLLMTRHLGKRWMDKYRATIAAGITLGEGLAIVIAVSISVAAKATWAGVF